MRDHDPTNPCHVDLERLERARANSELTEQLGGGVSRTIAFEAGLDHRAHPAACGGGGHGQSGMDLRFVFKGPLGATHWLCHMSNWVPGNVKYGTVGRLPDDTQNLDGPSLLPYVPVKDGRLGDGMAADLGYHSPTSRYDEQHGSECEYLPEGYCYYDGSGLNAEPVLEAFLAHGPEAVWVVLSRYYAETFGSGRELPPGDGIEDAEIVD